MRDDNFNNKQIRGLELTVNSVKKKFPFIIDWKINKNFYKYETVIYLDFYIDWELLSKVSNYPLRTHYKTYLPNDRKYLVSSSLGVFFGHDNEPALDETEYNSKKFDYFYNLKKSINEMLSKNYELLPDEFKVEYKNKFMDTYAVPMVDDFLDYTLF